MAAAGAFGTDATGPVTALIYWHLTGGQKPGEARALYSGKSADLPAAIRGARELARYIRRNRIQLVHAFDVPTSTMFSPTPTPPAVSGRAARNHGIN